MELLLSCRNSPFGADLDADKLQATLSLLESQLQVCLHKLGGCSRCVCTIWVAGTHAPCMHSMHRSPTTLRCLAHMLLVYANPPKLSCLHMHMLTHANAHTCICSHMQMLTHVHMLTHAYSHTCICSHMHMLARAYALTCTRSHMHMLTRASTHTLYIVLSESMLLASILTHIFTHEHLLMLSHINRSPLTYKTQLVRQSVGVALLCGL